MARGRADTGKTAHQRRSERLTAANLNTETGHSRVDLSSAFPLIAFIVVAIGTTVPILAHLYLPLVDLPNHIARHHFAAAPDGPLSAFYIYTAALVPNSAVDMVWRVLSFPGDPLRFSQLAMAFYAFGMVSATMILSRVVNGGWSAWPAATALIVFNGPFFWGFQNYLVTVPFAILGIALWIGLESRHLALRLAVFLPFAFILYLMHFFAFSILAIAAFGREVQLLATAGNGKSRQLVHSGLLALPFLLPIAWLVSETLNSPPSPAGSKTQYGSLTERAEALFSPFTGPNVDIMPQINMVGMVGFVVLLLCFLTALRQSGPRLRFAPSIIGPIAALAVASVCAPTWLNGVALVHIRLPFVLLALMLAGSNWKGLDKTNAIRLAAIVVLIVGTRSVYVERFFSRHDAEMRDLASTLDALPTGARLLPARAPGYEPDRRLWHVQAYAVSARDAFVPTLFQGVHAIKIKPGLESSAHPASYAPNIERILGRDSGASIFRYLEDWPKKFTHVLLMDTMDQIDDRQLRMISRHGRFTLFQIENSE